MCRSARSPARFGVVGSAALVLAGLLVAPGTATAKIDPNSVTTQASVLAVARDGDGSEDLDSISRSSFTTFLRTVNASDGGGGRRADAHVEQDTEVLKAGNELLGVNTSGLADASSSDSNTSDQFPPSAGGGSGFTLGFNVVNAPVDFRLTGRIDASGVGNGCVVIRVTDPSGGSADTTACPAPAGGQNIDVTGTLAPGGHTFDVGYEMEAEGPDPASGTATAEYDLKLRFCTILVQPGQGTLGTPGDDVICGTPGNDNGIVGRGGEDTIFGFGGADFINGGDGDDKIDAGDGNDTFVYGGKGDDTIDAGNGNDGDITTDDVVAGGPGDDEIDGGAGNDALVGRCGEDLKGVPSSVCPGDPPTPGEDEFDKIDGGFGNDSILGDFGTNILRGEDGNDTVAAGDDGGRIELGKGADNAVGGAGFDQIDGGPGNDGGVIGLSGGGGIDEITGGSGDDKINGDSGSDDLFGNSGVDSLIGFENNDCLVGGSGKDSLKAGEGDDLIIAKDGVRDTGTGGPGPDEGSFDAQDTIASVQARNHQGGC